MVYQSSGGRGYSARKAFKSSQSSVKDDLFYYFYHIDERDDYPTRFEEQWKKLLNFDWNPKQISNILSKVGEHIAGLQDFDPQRAEELKAIINRHWRCWQDPALKVIDQFEPINLQLSLKGHRDLELVPTLPFKKAWLKRARSTARSFKDHHFTAQIHDAASLGVFLPQAAFTTLLDRLSNSSDFLRDTGKTTLIWSIATHHAMRPLPECEKIASLLKQQMRPNARSIAMQKMRHDAALYFGWEQTFENPIRLETTSRDETQFREILESAGVETTKHEARIPGFNQAIDFTATVNGIDVELEIDGPTHFNQMAGFPNTYHLPYKGKDLLRSKLLFKAAPQMRLLRIPYTITDIILGRGRGEQYSLECRGKIARHFIEKAAAQSGGLYRASMRPTNSDTLPFILTHLIPKTRARSIH